MDQITTIKYLAKRRPWWSRWWGRSKRQAQLRTITAAIINDIVRERDQNQCYLCKCVSNPAYQVLLHVQDLTGHSPPYVQAYLLLCEECAKESHESIMTELNNTRQRMVQFIDEYQPHSHSLARLQRICDEFVIGQHTYPPPTGFSPDTPLMVTCKEILKILQGAK